MQWSEVNVGKWRGKSKSLPQIVFQDPDWFFWACENNALQSVRREALHLRRRATSIRIPRAAQDEAVVAEYFIHPPTGKFGGVQIVPASQALHEGSSPAWRQPVLDLSVARSIAAFDKRGGAILSAHVREIVMPGVRRLTRKVAEGFFDDDANFVL